MIKNISLKILSLFFLANFSLRSEETIVRVAFLELKDEIRDTQKLILELLNLIKDKDIAAVIIMIDSPGGSASSSSAAHEILVRVKEFKPVVSVVIGQCTSAAYLLASATSYIIAPEMSDIGSIGVVASFHKYLNPSIREKIHADIQSITVTAGKDKAITNPFTPMTEEARVTIQHMVNEHYKSFCAQVARNRGLDLSKIHDWADAKIFNGKRAFELGLIDKIGSILDAEEAVLQLLNSKRSIGTPVVTEIERVFIKLNCSAKEKDDQDNSEVKIMYMPIY